ncbi:thiol reductant ABC exporter subunit CydD [Halochromatium salexigens]|uniref:Thiol reductant ABC exporter subunit CydD n=1 Tax=Halochromatium salexigens TaxID=49447 RepID=A0AAJ0XFH1_HALSE|nr:thiol reductant ABC exporter subunit CydD [Halochromatium salexigens]MBK5929672.1 thiol reductant ABC exporter subunit CydD [Halochromatium salexigens]
MTAPRTLLDDQKPLAARWLRLSVGLGLGNGVLLILQAWLLAQVIDALVFTNAALADVTGWLWPLLALFALRALLAWASEQNAFRAAAQVKISLRDRLYRHIQAAGPAWMAGQRSGAIAEDLTRGIEAVEAYYSRYLPAMSLTALIPLTILIVVLPLDWLSALIMLVTAPLIPIFMILIGSGVERLNQQLWKDLARMGAHFLDVIQGMTTLKLFNASRREAEVIARISEDYRASTMRVLRVAFLTSAVLELFSTLGIAIIAVFIGFRLYQLELPIPELIAPPEISFVTGFFILLLAPEFYAPLRNLGTHYHGRMEAIAAAERLVAVMETELPAPPKQVASLSADSPLQIRFEGVSFSYEPGRPALAGAQFEINPGERIALVGPSGAGKTTVASLLLGFIRPEAGRISVDGEDLNALAIDDWRRRLAWLPQQPRLFQGTIADNIRLGLPDATLDEVRQAAERAQATEFIERLPLGYDSPVGERGSGLSGGQIQRVALARAFLRDARLVILDEATASLDPASEALVQRAVDQLAEGRSMLIIAHRLSTVRNADRILVIDDGRIVEAGTHAELIERDGPYRRMVRLLEPGGAHA